MPQLRADLPWHMPHGGEGEVKKYPANARGGGGGGRVWMHLELIEP